MNLKNNFWYFESVLTPRFCNEVIRYGGMQEEQLALTGGFNLKDPKNLTKKEEKDLKKKRNSNIVWLNDTWIFKEIHPYVHMANKNAEWNFEWDYSESCQFTKYKLNQYYDWHCDSWNEPYKNHSNNNFNGKIRKLSVTCCLSSPEDYVGGDLEFATFDSPKKPIFKKCAEKIPLGSVIVFPSFMWHRVKPVIEGTRYSLVIWNLGRPFK